MGEQYVRMRLLLMRLVLILAIGALALRLWQLQVVSSQEYQESADLNRFRLVPVDAPRGIIYDRYGRLLVRNIPSFTVSIVPAALPDDPRLRLRVLQRLSDLLGMPVTTQTAEGVQSLPFALTDAGVPIGGASGPGIEEILRERTISPYAPVDIRDNVDRQAAFAISEESITLPGIFVQAKPLRQYIDGPLTAHVLGYVGRIPKERLDEYTAQGDYRPNDRVGLMGVEMSEDALLRGTRGEKHVEVDAFEREVAVVASRPPMQGQNLMLTIDLDLQRVTENALRAAMARAHSEVGAVVVLDPRTGEVLALVSLPSYDNNLFSGGISYEDYVRLSSDVHRPLINHAIGGQYPPGSTFKLVTASAALQEEVVGRSTTRVCRGTLLLPNRYFPDDWSKAQPFYCWNRGGHGSVNVISAIGVSCDIYFYQVAGGYENFEGLGIDRLARYARMFGYGDLLGLGLPGEVGGLIPDDRWKRQVIGETWLTGDTYNAAIGQGYVLATPLQVANATVAVANGGTLYRPQLVYQVTDGDGRVVQAMQPEPIRVLDVAPANLDLVRQGMRQAVLSGMAPAVQLTGIAVAGKTGTAEYAVFDAEGKLVRDELGRLPTHAWFTAFAPYEDPEIALVVFLEGGGVGSTMAAPVAGDILRYYFGVAEPTPIPTAAAAVGD